MTVTHKPKAGSKLTGTEYEAADSHILALADGDIPSTIARDSEVTAAISALSSVYQPLDSDLTAIASLTTTSFGRGLLELANAAALLSAAGGAAASHAHAGGDITSGTVAEARIDATIARDSEVTSAISALSSVYQPLDSDLTSIAALTTTAFGRGLLELADQAALLSAAGAAASGHDHSGTYQPADSDLTTIAGLTPSDDDVLQRKSGAWTNRTIAQLSADLPPNADPEPVTAQASVTMVATTESGHGFVEGSNCASVDLNDTSDFAIGSQSVAFVTDGAGGAADVHAYGLTTFSLEDRTPVIWVKVENVAKLSSLVLRVGSSSGSAYFGWAWTQAGGLTFQDGEWVRMAVPWADYNANTGSSTRDRFTDITVMATDDGTGAVTVHFNGLGWVPQPRRAYPRGVVTICFDDGWDSTYTIARPLLDARGFRASVFPIITGASGIGESGRLTIAQLQQLRDRSGWDFGVHAYATQTHTDRFTGLTDAALVADLTAAKAWHVANGLPGSHMVGYPGGEFDSDSLGIVGRYFSAGRSTYARTETIPATNPLRLRASSSISSFSGGASAATITGKIDRIAANGGWLVLVFHRLVASDPANTQDCLTSDFTTIIDHCVSKGVPVRTMSEVLAAPPLDWQQDDGGSRPEHHGLIAWAYDPAAASGTIALATAGTVYAVKMWVPRRTLATNIVICVTTQGNTLTADQCFAGLYQDGRRIGVTADQSTAWGSTGVKTMALTSPAVVERGWVYVALLFNGTTGPTINRALSGSLANLGLSSSTSSQARTYRWATADTSQTSLPTSLGSLSSYTTTLWAGLS